MQQLVNVDKAKEMFQDDVVSLDQLSLPTALGKRRVCLNICHVSACLSISIYLIFGTYYIYIKLAEPRDVAWYFRLSLVKF